MPAYTNDDGSKVRFDLGAWGPSTFDRRGVVRFAVATMSNDDDTALTQTVQQTQFSGLVPSAGVESTGEVDGQFIIYEGAITKDDDTCLGFFSNAFRLPQGQVPFLKILMEDTLADEEDQTVYNDRKREIVGQRVLVPGSNGEDDVLGQYYAKLKDNANPTAAGWLASMLSRWAVKSDYLPRAGKDFVKRLVSVLTEKHIPHAISLQPIKAIIKAVAFHPYLKRLAVARDDDSVCVYDLQKTVWLPVRLSHEFQKDIKCLEWQPMSGSRLAVGGSRGVCIWRLNGTYLLGVSYGTCMRTEYPLTPYSFYTIFSRPQPFDFRCSRRRPRSRQSMDEIVRNRRAP